MRERRLFMTLGIVLAVLALGVAYATVLNVDLSITGTATGLASEDNFNVKFTHVSAVTGTGEVDTSGSTAKIDSTDPTTGIFNFKGFITKGQTQSATWTISNENEAELYAHIEANSALECTDGEYFRGRCNLESEVIEPNGTTTLTVTVECIKTPTIGTVTSGVLRFGFTATAAHSADTEGDGGTDNPIIPPATCVHSYGDWVTSIAATCRTAGQKTRVCQNCTALRTEVITALGHNWVNGVCSRCGFECKHTFVDGTCTECGVTCYVGCYADMDRDGTVDGVIFADLGYGQVGDGAWGTNGWGTYSVPKIESGLKEYEISRDSYTDDFGEAPVIRPVLGTSGTDRFYIMALNDFTTSSYTTFYWYYNGRENMSDYATYTLQNFGTGKANTGAMIARWNKGAVSNGGYGDQHERDIWKHIQTKYAEGWFIPSRAELTAFAGELGEATLDPALTTSNYSSTYGLSSYYWSSSQYNSDYAYIARFDSDNMSNSRVDNIRYVRLCTTF